jgi:1,4-alpha-glucan branching enzyme
MIELMPVTSMAYSNGWGYAPNYIYSVESMLGGRHGLMKFVKACHERGIGVILDVVYNHFYGDTDLWKFDGWSENDHYVVTIKVTPTTEGNYLYTGTTTVYLQP